MSIRGVIILVLTAGPLGLNRQDLPPLPGKGLGQHPFLYCGKRELQR